MEWKGCGRGDRGCRHCSVDRGDGVLQLNGGMCELIRGKLCLTGLGRAYVLWKLAWENGIEELVTGRCVQRPTNILILI